LLQKLKRAFREFKAGVPGRRFVDHYQRSRGPQGARGASWKTFGYVAAGLVLVICGLVLSLPPGIPGFLLWIPGLLLLASRFKGLAMLLDRLEAWGRQAWQRFVTRR
jgi:hypothetical protein